MSATRLIDALALPASSRVDQKVPKTVLTEQGAATAADKRQIKEGIEALWWLAALKPNTIGVPLFREESREYLEIAVLHGQFRPKAKVSRLIELIHRSIPYPVLLIVENDAGLALSLAHKRWAQNEAGKMVLEEGFPHTTPITDDAPEAFFEHLALNKLPQTDMWVLYQGWLAVLIALEAYHLTGEFRLASVPEQTPKRRAALRQIRELDAEITRLRKQAAKEKQMARQVELNMSIKRLEAKRQALLNEL